VPGLASQRVASPPASLTLSCNYSSCSRVTASSGSAATPSFR
jgi:hypothetical protein